MSQASSYLESSIESFVDFDDIALRIWTLGIVPNLFFSIYPAILIYLIEFQNVTFRRLVKSCERQPKLAPITAYILALSLISGILTTITYCIKPTRIEVMMPIKMFLLFIFMVIALFMCNVEGQFRYQSKSIYHEHKEHLLGEDYPQKNHKKKGFLQLLFGNWAVLHYEITQKAVFLIAFTGEPIRAFICAVVAYACLSVTAAVIGRKVAKEELQKFVRFLAGIGIVIWAFVPFLLIITVA